MVTRNQLVTLKKQVKIKYGGHDIPVKIVEQDTEGYIIETLGNGEEKRYTEEEFDKVYKEWEGLCIIRSYYEPTLIVDDIV